MLRYRKRNGTPLISPYGIHSQTPHRPNRLPTIQQAFMDRLSSPHPTIAETSQAYSTFNSTYAPSTYEESMVKASKVASKSTARWDAREAWEQGWTALSSQEEDDAQRMQKVAYLYAYLEMELATGKGKKVEPGMVVRVYERWVAVCAVDASREGRVAEAGVWDKYITYVVRPNRR